MKPRVYIAGPMTGIADHNYPAFHQAQRKWEEKGWVVLNPATHFDGDTTLPYEAYMERALSEVLKCDVIAMLPGWENSRGARMEKYVAEEMGKKVWPHATAPLITHEWVNNICCTMPAYHHYGAKEGY